MSVRGPWYITLRAIEQYLELQGRDPATCSESTLARAEDDLVAMAIATVASGRQPSITDSGLLRFRGPKPHRLTLVVSPTPRAEGELPQLVGVTSPRRIR